MTIRVKIAGLRSFVKDASAVGQEGREASWQVEVFENLCETRRTVKNVKSGRRKERKERSLSR